MTVQVPTSPSVCFCTTWGKRNSQNRRWNKQKTSKNSPDITMKDDQISTVFWHKHSWQNWPLNDRSSFHITQRLFLHYLQKAQQAKYALKCTNVHKFRLSASVARNSPAWVRSLTMFAVSCSSESIGPSSSSWREGSWGPLRRLSMMTVILCLLPLQSDTQWWSIANLHDPRVTRTSRSSPPDSVRLVSGLDSNDLLQDLMCWSGGVQSGHESIGRCLRMSMKSRSDWLNFRAKHYRHCYQLMEKASARLCSHKGPIFRIFTAILRSRF